MRKVDGKLLFAGFGALVCALALVGCASEDLPPGTVRLGLVEAPQAELLSLHTGSSKPTSVIVTISEIQAHIDGGAWVTISNQPTTVDLRKLSSDRIPIGIGQLPTGHIDGLRLLLDAKSSYVIDGKGVQRPLALPASRKIKIIGKIDLDDCTGAAIVVDFDAKVKNDDCDDKYKLEVKGSVHAKDLKNYCSPDAGNGGGGTPCGNGGVVCPPSEMCVNGNCLDPCIGVTCSDNKQCIKGSCVSQHDCDNDND